MEQDEIILEPFYEFNYIADNEIRFWDKPSRENVFPNNSVQIPLLNTLVLISKFEST